MLAHAQTLPIVLTWQPWLLFASIVAVAIVETSVAKRNLSRELGVTIVSLAVLTTMLTLFFLWCI